MQPELVKDLPSVSAWLCHAEATRRIVNENYQHLNLTEEQRPNIAVQENVLVQIENLKTHPAVASRLARGELNLHGWTYKIETGAVFSFDSKAGQFTTISETAAASTIERARFPLDGIL